MTSSTSPVWASSPLSIDQDQTLDQITNALTVRLIATMSELKTTTLDAVVSEAVKLADADGFDYLPVRDMPDGSIVGIFSRSTSPGVENMAPIRKVYEPLGSNDLISSETSLLNFLCSADEQLRRLVLDGTTINGIVTLSDIQKLPVRMALFSLFIHFELLLTEELRKALGDADPCVHLTPKRAKYVRARWQLFTKSRMDQDVFSAMDLYDKRAIAMKLSILGKPSDLIDKSIEGIEKHLRNPIAHGVEYAQTNEAARKTIQAARDTRDWISELKNAQEGDYRRA
jgi:hypothetical protein